MPTTIAALIGAGILSLLIATFMIYQVMKADEGTETMRNIGKAIQEGSMAFLRREYTYLAAFVVLVAVVVGILIDPQTAGAYVIGALISAFTGFLGMMVATRANTRTAAAAARGLNPALRIAFSSGAVMGLSVVGLGLIGVGLTFWGYAEGYGNTDIKQIVQWVTGFSFGASSIALFARVGGGIYTKAADVGADLVGKVEQGITFQSPN